MYLSKRIECTTPRVNINVNDGLGGDYQCVSVGSSIVTSVPLWWGMLIMGEAMRVWGQGLYGESLYPPPRLNFAVNLKPL